jgi:hypothetical protein
VVHDVFCRVGPRIAQLDNPAAYLRVAVVNQCRSIHRRMLRALPDRPSAQCSNRPHRAQRRPAGAAGAATDGHVLRYLCDLPDEIAEILDCRPPRSARWSIVAFDTCASDEGRELIMVDIHADRAGRRRSFISGNCTLADHAHPRRSTRSP